MDYIDLRHDDYRPAPPPADIARRYGIAIVGCGSTARLAHLPAYRTCGYRVVATCDIVAANAHTAATDSAIPFWTTQIDEVLERPAGKPKKVALVACMRKLLTILNAMVRHQTPWCASATP
jgi:hypothetical protein